MGKMPETYSQMVQEKKKKYVDRESRKETEGERENKFGKKRLK